MSVVLEILLSELCDHPHCPTTEYSIILKMSLVLSLGHLFPSPNP